MNYAQSRVCRLSSFPWNKKIKANKKNKKSLLYSIRWDSRISEATDLLVSRKAIYQLKQITIIIMPKNVFTYPSPLNGDQSKRSILRLKIWRHNGNKQTFELLFDVKRLEKTRLAEILPPHYIKTLMILLHTLYKGLAIPSQGLIKSDLFFG